MADRRRWHASSSSRSKRSRIGGKARGEAFDALLEEYGANFDTDSRTIVSAPLLESELGECAVRFTGLLLRLKDLALMSPQIVRSTFKEDALAAIHSTFDEIAKVTESEPLSAELVGQEADVMIRASSQPPLAIYFATSEERALQALVTKMEAEKYRQIAGSVVLMVERAKANPVKEPTYSLALARLDADRCVPRSGARYHVTSRKSCASKFATRKVAMIGGGAILAR